MHKSVNHTTTAKQQRKKTTKWSRVGIKLAVSATVCDFCQKTKLQLFFSPRTATALGRIKWLVSLWSHGNNRLCCVCFGRELCFSVQLQHCFQIPTKYAPTEAGAKSKAFLFLTWLYCVNRTEDLSVLGPYNLQPKLKHQIHFSHRQTV